jgi:hypothetical protein
MAPWVKWLCIGTYWGMTALIVSAGPHDITAFGMGIAMLVLGVTWTYVGTQKISRAIEWIVDTFAEFVATILIGALKIGIPLVTLYFLVRFVKWAWIND